MKKHRFFSLLLACLAALFALPAAATCTTPPVLTGGVPHALNVGYIGSKSAAAPNPEFINAAYPHTSPSAEAYSIDVFTSISGPYKFSFGSGSGVEVKFGAQCTTALWGPECFTGLAPQRITNVAFAVTFAGPTGLTPVTRARMNYFKLMEWWGAAVQPAGGTWSDGVSRILVGGDGRTNRFKLEGWDTVNGVTTWKSIDFLVTGECS